MRKQITAQAGSQTQSTAEAGGWLDLEQLAQVEVSSEALGHPIENALVPGSPSFWQAAHSGPATITLRFDLPQAVRRIQLHVTELQHERSQEWALTAEFADGTRRELLRQGWNFSPSGSNEQQENYSFDLKSVKALALTIDPDRGRDRYPAILSAWRVSATT